MWGKWAQNQKKTQTTIVNSEKEFYELLTSPDTEFTKPQKEFTKPKKDPDYNCEL